ncbi:amidohydrolase [Leifsonia sp. LS-T14]|uniref:amidohydrolase family protein n=1 Tax=unclassified Leifsonia TaxID=2663824 RepID=UPI0035A58FD2
MLIDAHLHIWDRRRAAYSWLRPDLAPIDRDMRFEEILPALDRFGVDGVVLVQSADEVGDTANMLDVAETEPRVVGVVGWLPLEDPDDVARRLPAFRADARIVGVRNLIHDRPDADWVHRPDFNSSLSLLDDAGLPFDFVTSGPAALASLIEVADRHPGLRIVLDHLGKPPIGSGDSAIDEWAALLHEAADRPNVYAKVSGLYASTGAPGSWTPSQVIDVCQVALQEFGAERLMFGGDWPISVLAGGYDRIIAAVRDAVALWPDPDRERFFGGTAIEFYGLLAPAASNTGALRSEHNKSDAL